MTRLESICLKLAQQSIDYCILSHKASILYACGLPPTHPTEREAYLFINPEEIVLYHSPFVIPPQNSKIKAVPMSPKDPLATVVKRQFQPASAIGIEAEDMSVAERDRLLNILHTEVKTVPIDNEIKNQRMIKDEIELKYLRKAILITKKTLKWIEQFIYSPAAIGISELQLQRMIENKFFELGATGTAFPTIVAFDSHSASPHHMPTSRKLKSSSIVLVDLGASYHHYCGDMTRTWCLGKPQPLYTKIEQVVKKAYRAAYRRVSGPAFAEATVGKSAGQNVSASEVDIAARTVIEKAGMSTFFIHTTGHGIGIEAHEMPSINSNNQQELKPGMAITIEPGIYLPVKFGYRYENTIIL